MILDIPKTVQHITDWLVDYAKTAGKTYFVYDIHVGDSNYVLESICKKQTQINHGSQINDGPNRSHEAGLYLSKVDRCIIHLDRTYDKYGNAADLYPLGDLFSSEIYQLANYFSLKISLKNNNSFDSDDIEWADRENQLTGIIVSDESPLNFPQWWKYSKHQKEVISKLHQREKKTRHKIIHAPICKVRDIPGLVQ